MQRNGVERDVAFLEVARVDDDDDDAILARLDDGRRSAVNAFEARDDEADLFNGAFRAERRH